MATKKFAYFQHVSVTANEFVLRRWAKFDVQVTNRVGCLGCQALRRELESLPCVGRIDHREHASSCHRYIQLLAPRNATLDAGQIIGELRMPKTENQMVFHRELCSDLCIKKPFKPMKHQQAYIDHFSEHPPRGIGLFFTLGSGKTHTALGLFHALNATEMVVVCGITLIQQWVTEIGHHAPPTANSPPVEYRVYGYNRFAGLVYDNPNLVDGVFTAVDEAHNYKNMTDNLRPSIEALRLSSCCQLLTGTPLTNDVRDLDYLLHLLGVEEYIAPLQEGEAGYGNKQWNHAIPPNPYQTPDVLIDLLQALTGKVVFYDPKLIGCAKEIKQHYPQTVEQTVYHDLHWVQVLELFLFGSGISINVNGTKVNVGNSGGVLRKLSIMNAVVHQIEGESEKTIYSSKADTLVREIEAVGLFPQVVYSRFKANLLSPLRLRIEQHFKKRTALLTGDTPSKDRQPLLQAYNDGKIDVLLICAVGSEGLDLNISTAALHLLEPQYNIPSENQVIGRVVRYSKKKRAPDTPPVQIKRYVARFPKTPPKNRTILDALEDIVNSFPNVVRAFTATQPAGRETVQAKDILRWLQERIREEKNITAEQHMSMVNTRKYERIKPLVAMLWMASPLYNTPKQFRQEWSNATGQKLLLDDLILEEQKLSKRKKRSNSAKTTKNKKLLRKKASKGNKRSNSAKTTDTNKKQLLRKKASKRKSTTSKGRAIKHKKAM